MINIRRPAISRAMTRLVFAVMALPAMTICPATIPALAQATQAVIITVHANKTIAPYKPLWNFFGADEPNFTYAPNGQKLLHELGSLGPAEHPIPVYFRPHNLLTTGNGDSSLKWGSTNAYTEKPDGTAVYDWTITDRIFDAITAAHVRPIVEIGFMPEALSTHPEPYRHTFPKGDIYTGWAYPPRDYAKWGKLIHAYAEHLKQRYGSAVDNWMWEVWNEPDIGYWQGTPEEYDHLYDITTSAIRTVLPNARIGGPESTGVASSRAEAFLRQFLEHCAHGTNTATGAKGAPLDFISYHPKGRPSTVNGHVRMDIGHQLRAIDRGMRVIASYPEWKNTPIVLGESDPEGCAACKGPENGYRNGPLYGVSVAEATMRTYELARKYGLTVEGSVTWAFEFENQPYFAGFRELATNGIDKPVLNVFRMMGKLNGNWVQADSTGALSLDDIEQVGAVGSPDINAAATSSSAGNQHELDILLWNYHDDDLPTTPVTIQLNIDGLAAAKSATAEEFRMDATHSNSYAVWQQMGSPQTPTSEQQKQLEASGDLQQSVAQHSLSIANDTAATTLQLPRQGVALVRLRWQQ
ncbi:GH39 family glycosyl hydrolase [Acidicapsa ligni]|uniref:GH39 family glycosyl hydrolase n=1 Tax=Acidicapsa ligni TaxID=542300 RepID=UPI0021E02BFD|nr:beta-xylosidase [Acidicapsa ligni]